MMKKNSKGNINTYLNWPIILSVYLLLVVVIIYAIDSAAGLACSLFLLFYVLFAVYLKFVKYNNLYPSVMKIAEEISKEQNAFFNKIDFPHAIISEDCRILWGNDKFLDISKSLFVGNKITNIFPEINKDILLSIKGDRINLLTSYDDKKYKANLFAIDLNGMNISSDKKLFDEPSKVIMLYLNDETDYYDLKQEYDNDKQVIGFIYIDNFYEVTENMEDSKASMLIAMVDRKLTRYISYNSGILKKLEKDKYFFVTTKKDIEDMMEDRFSVLEQTKDILGSDNIPLTLSIGVGYEGKSIESNHDLAKVAIDMALGRGGDQAVVKKGQETIFYGGKSASSTTNVRVRARVKATSFKETLDTKDKVLIMGHKNGDFDSFGASIGTYIMAKQHGKDVHIVINSLTHAVEDMKKKYIESGQYDKDMFVTGDEALNIVDSDTLLVIVDHNTSKISDETRLFEHGLDVVVFDHHRIGQHSVNDAILSYIDSSASSTCELVSEVMIYFDDRLKIRSLDGDSMLAGMMIDTKYFTYQTSAKTFEAAAFLRKRGADSDRVKKMLRVNVEFEQLKNKAVSNAQYYKGVYAIAILDDVDERVEISVAKAEVANELINIKNVKASFVISFEEGKYMISSRSIDEMNVQVLMEKLGGGGHRSSAGASVDAGSFDEVVRIVEKVIDETEIEGERK